MKKLVLAILVAECFIMVSDGFGMYDPQVGRFMQRDPLGIDPAGGTQNLFSPQGQYKEYTNTYEYVGSNSILNRDALGLCSISVKDLGVRDPKIVKTSYGTTLATAMTSILKWNHSITKKPCGNSGLFMIVDAANCGAEIEYWYSDQSFWKDSPVYDPENDYYDLMGNTPQEHELVHVNNSLLSWHGMKLMSLPFKYRCMCPDKIECYGRAITFHVNSAFENLRNYLDSSYECLAYDESKGKSSHCARASSLAPQVAEAFQTAAKELGKCMEK